MSTCSKILAWKILWTEEPGELQCIGLQRVRHDWATDHTHTHHLWKEAGAFTSMWLWWFHLPFCSSNFFFFKQVPTGNLAKGWEYKIVYLWPLHFSQGSWQYTCSFPGGYAYSFFVIRQYSSPDSKISKLVKYFTRLGLQESLLFFRLTVKIFVGRIFQGYIFNKTRCKGFT